MLLNYRVLSTLVMRCTPAFSSCGQIAGLQRYGVDKQTLLYRINQGFMNEGIWCVTMTYSSRTACLPQ